MKAAWRRSACGLLGGAGPHSRRQVAVAPAPAPAVSANPAFQDSDETGVVGAPDGVDWAHLPRPAADLCCVVIVPVRNEARLLPRALRALAAQRGVIGGSYEVLVLANNCSDDSAQRARAVAADCGGCPIHVAEVAFAAARANVGVARRALMDQAVQRLAAAAKGVIASTDGDSRVDPDWLARNLAAIARGADAVGGRILTQADRSWPAGIVRLQRLDLARALLRSRLESLVDPDPGDPWPRHHQHFGASLAITARALRRIGGQPIVPWLEDEALVAALRRIDGVVRHDPGVRVRTSGRFEGRAAVGLSWQLRTWAQQMSVHEPHRVVDPDHELARWRARRAARCEWQRRSRDAVAGDVEPFGTVWEATERRRIAAEGEPPRVPLERALVRLRQLLDAFR